MTGAPLLELRDVTVDFGGVRAVNAVTIAVDEGTVCGLVGPNGSGKTTLLGVISGMVQPTQGSLALGGEPIPLAHPAAAARAGIARTFQNIRLVDDISVLENVMIGAGIDLRRRQWGSLGAGRAAHAELGERSREALHAVGIEQFASRAPGELPYGSRRRVEVARALAMRPRLLLLDEPAAGMTPVERAELGDVITGLASSGITTVLVEHDFAMIGRVCPRVIVLDAGRCIADGAPADVAMIPAVQEAYLGRKHEAVDDARSH